ncbi:LysE family translocator [Microbispora sp. ATCC PTA-5024]|uniref:LysE family translocator n=1 Tax=Microbispora sp. ATCC PTA-5024 TaxID=316330 RepID=UPI0003DCEF50|nr:LysE family translocator [Microbispora sp. ATCC PTA-5024]ETK31052.1 lysine transporter LysE [Microbispora sp. ATCC PTA-5024]
MSIGALLGIAMVALGMVLTPGPNMIYLVSRSISQGRRAGLVSLGGVAAGFLVYLAASCLGLTAVFALVPEAYLAIKLAGAAYLLHLAWKTVRPGGVSVFQPRDLRPDSTRRLFTMGLVTNVLNPKAAVLYLSLLPQFVDPAEGHVMTQSFALGSVQIAVSMLVNTVIVLTAASLAAFLATRPGWLRLQRYVMGTMLGAFAVKLAVDRPPAVVTAS